MPKRILVGYDRSDVAERALAWALDEQRRSGAELRVIESIDPLPAVAAMLPVPTLVTPEELAQMRAQLSKDVAAKCAKATSDVVLGPNPGEAIVEAAEAWGADLVVVGTHGRTGVRRLVLGSVAEYVVRHAKCPVLNVR